MKTLGQGDLESAAFFIQNNADICLANANEETPIAIIFRENIIRLKRVLRENFPAKKYKDLENKYQDKSQLVSNYKSQQSNKKLPNGLIGTLANQNDLITGKCVLRRHSYGFSSTTDLGQKLAPTHKTKNLTLIQTKIGSEEVLTNVTNPDKAPPNKSKEDNEIGWLCESKDQLNSDLLPKSVPNENYKQQMKSYAEQISITKSEIARLEQVRLLEYKTSNCTPNFFTK